MMKQSVKEKWVQALRSRKFKQYCGGALKVPIESKKNKEQKYAHCCLGVLHEIDNGKWHIEEKRGVKVISTGSKQNILSSNDEILCGPYKRGLLDDQLRKLMDMNDDGVKFNKIANWIEKNIKTKNK